MNISIENVSGLLDIFLEYSKIIEIVIEIVMHFRVVKKDTGTFRMLQE